MTPKGTICWLTAVAGSLLVGLWSRGENLGVMAADNGSHIVRATVATFHIAPVEEFPVAVLFREVLIQELKEPLGNVSSHTLYIPSWQLSDNTVYS